MDSLPVAPTAFSSSAKELSRALLGAGKPREEVITELKALAEKCGYCYEDSWMPFAGATSFAEYDQYLAASTSEAAMYELTYAYRSIVSNIMESDDLSIADKTAAVIAASQDMAKRIPTPPDTTLEAAEGDIQLAEDGVTDGGVRALGSRILRAVTGRKPAEKAVTEAVTTAPPEGGSFRAFKDASGTLRWIAVYSNNFKDLEDETFPLESHKEFVEWVDSPEGKLPELWAWHTPGTRLGVAEAIDLTSEGFMVAAGVFDEAAKDSAERLVEMGPQAVSHGYEYLKAGLVNGVYTKDAHYRTFEISTIPVGREANPIGTSFNAEEVIMLTKEKRDYFTNIYGSEKVAALEKNIGEAAAMAKDKGISFKDLTEAFAETAAEAPAIPPAAAPAAGDAPDLTQALAAAMAPLLAPVIARLDAQDAAAAETAKTIKELQVSEDSKIAEHFRARGGPGAGFVASADKSTEANGNSRDIKEAAEGLKTDGPAGSLAEIAAGAPDYQKPYVEMLGALLGGAGGRG